MIYAIDPRQNEGIARKFVQISKSISGDILDNYQRYEALSPDEIYDNVPQHKYQNHKISFISSVMCLNE